MGWVAPGEADPLEVQQKEFRVARFGAGYRMREVDEFLDHVTDTLTALIAENERLLRTAGPRSSAAPAVGAPTSDEDRAAVDAFLRTEKGFLQDLGVLVQSHAEELKTMVRSARSETVAPEGAGAVEAVGTDTDTDADADADPDRPRGRRGCVSSRDGRRGPSEDQQPAVEPAEATSPQDEEATVAMAEPSTGGEDTTTDVTAEEPIRLEQPSPHRSGRSEDERDGSLRELFWGEE